MGADILFIISLFRAANPKTTNFFPDEALFLDSYTFLLFPLNFPSPPLSFLAHDPNPFQIQP